MTYELSAIQLACAGLSLGLGVDPGLDRRGAPSRRDNHSRHGEESHKKWAQKRATRPRSMRIHEATDPPEAATYSRAQSSPPPLHNRTTVHLAPHCRRAYRISYRSGPRPPTASPQENPSSS